MADQAGIDEQIRQLVASHRPQLERLVDQALERELAQLVEQRLAAHNGKTAAPQVSAGSTEVGSDSAPASKVCDSCGETKPASAFETGRRKCRACRRAHERERAARRDAEQAPAEPDRPGGITADELARRANRHGAARARELQRWLLSEQLAEATPAGLVPTARTRMLAQDGELDRILDGRGLTFEQAPTRPAPPPPPPQPFYILLPIGMRRSASVSSVNASASSGSATKSARRNWRGSPSRTSRPYPAPKKRKWLS